MTQRTDIPKIHSS